MISVVVPTYNEKGNILPFVKQMEHVLEKISDDSEIIFVDDSSPDGTGKVIKNLQKNNSNLVLVEREKKEGTGAAHMAGFDVAKGDIIVTIDVDLSQNPKYLFDFKKKLDAGWDMVIGSRYIKGGGMEGKTFISHIGSRFANIMSSLILGIKIRDASHTFRAFKREVYNKLRGKLKSKGHPSFEVEFTYMATKFGFKICEIPMIFHEHRISGKSKIDIRREFYRYMKCLLDLRFRGDK